MHLGRFHAVIDDLADHFRTADLPAKIEQAAAQLDQYVAARAQPNLDSFRESIESLLKSSEISDPDLHQPFAHQVITELGLDDNLSPRFGSAITEAITKRSFDPTGLATELRQIGTQVTKKIRQINSIRTAFTELDVEFERVQGESAEVGFLLPREVVGDTLRSLTTEFNELGKLARAISEMVGAPDYDPKVVTIASSWWQVFLNLDANAILVWVLAIERIVNLFKSNLEIKSLQRQLSDKNVSKEITDLLEKEVERRISTALHDLASELRASHSKLEDTSRLNEVETQLRQGLYYLAKRINQGAQVEINVGIPTEPEVGATESEDATHQAEIGARIAEAREHISALRDLRERARSASAETASLDKSAPLLIASAPEATEGTSQAET